MEAKVPQDFCGGSPWSSGRLSKCLMRRSGGYRGGCSVFLSLCWSLVLDAVHYSIFPVNPGAHLFEVMMWVANPEPSGQELVLPVWIPGSYLVREFARHIDQVSAWACHRPPARLKHSLSAAQVRDSWQGTTQDAGQQGAPRDAEQEASRSARQRASGGTGQEASRDTRQGASESTGRAASRDAERGASWDARQGAARGAGQEASWRPGQGAEWDGGCGTAGGTLRAGRKSVAAAQASGRSVHEEEVPDPGMPVPVFKVDKHTWRCGALPTDGFGLLVRYQVYAWDLSVRAAHLDTTHGFCNGSSVCRPPGRIMRTGNWRPHCHVWRPAAAARKQSASLRARRQGSLNRLPPLESGNGPRQSGSRGRREVLLRGM